MATDAMDETVTLPHDAGVHLAPGESEDAIAWQRVEAGIAHEEAEEAKVDGDGHEPVESPAQPEADETDTLVDGELGDAAVSEEAYVETGADDVVTEVEGHVPEGVTVLDVHPELVHGTDDRVQVGNTHEYPWRTICHLRITTATGGTVYCSGSMIGPRTVLTNGHCVYQHDRGGWARQIEVTPGRNGPSGKPFGSAVSSHFITTKGWVNDKSWNYDYAVIILPESQPLGRRTGWMGLANLSALSLMGLRINNSGYPGDKPFGTQWWNANNILAVTSRRVYYRVDTANGQSGSPDWRYRNNKRHIVAVHNTGGNPFNGGVRIVKAVFDNLVKWKNTYT